jgi:hypothetical protein
LKQPLAAAGCESNDREQNKGECGGQDHDYRWILIVEMLNMQRTAGGVPCYKY